jgi:type I restriction enzyme S subunit
VLGAYDDLIEANRRRIAVLEEMARRAFEEWFFHFRFPGHEHIRILETVDGPLPDGWRYAGLHDVAEVAFGFPFRSKRFNAEGVGTRIVRIRDIPDGRSETWTDEPFDDRYSVNDGDLLIGMDGIFHTAIWSGGAAALNQRVTRLRPRGGRSVGWLLHAVLPKIEHLEAAITGTTVAHLSARDLQL